MNESLVIRKLEQPDAAAVDKILDLYWSDEFRESLTKSVHGFVMDDETVVKKRFQYYVAEKDGEIVGVGAFRDLPFYMEEYAQTDNAAEFYVLAVKQQRRGIGKAIFHRMIQDAVLVGYDEILWYSGISHQDAWAFHDSNGERVGSAVAPNGEPGEMWRLQLLSVE